MNDKILRIIADTLGVDVSSLNEQASMDNTPAWDSIAHLNLVLSLEQAFGQRFSPDEFMQMRSVDGIVQLLKERGAS